MLYVNSMEKVLFLQRTLVMFLDIDFTFSTKYDHKHVAVKKIRTSWHNRTNGAGYNLPTEHTEYSRLKVQVKCMWTFWLVAIVKIEWLFFRLCILQYQWCNGFFSTRDYSHNSTFTGLTIDGSTTRSAPTWNHWTVASLLVSGMHWVPHSLRFKVAHSLVLVSHLITM